MGKQARSKSKGKQRRAAPMAQSADVHALYQEAVQCVESEIDFVDETFAELRKRKARLLREDFCGTANTSCEWVRRRSTNHAIGVDLDPDVLEWGREHNLKKLGAAMRRVSLKNANVLSVKTEPVDALLAHNFSYWIFKERKLMRRYFRRVRSALASDGLFFLDCYGGSEAFAEMTEKTKNEGFTYIWDQASYNPINGDMVCHIHFKFRDGSQLRRAFTYTWRLWTLPELREILEEAGFARSTVYWEGTEEDTGEGDGVFEPTERGEADQAWIVYVVAEP